MLSSRATAACIWITADCHLIAGPNFAFRKMHRRGSVTRRFPKNRCIHACQIAAIHAGARTRARARARVMRAISAMRSAGAGARDRKLPLADQDNDNQADATRGASGV